MNTEANKEIRLTQQHIKAIEKGLDHRGVAEVVVRLENGKIIVFTSNKKKLM